MRNIKLITAILLASTSGMATASITGDTVVTFEKLAFGAYFGKASDTPLANGNCSGTGSNGCYIENGIVVGVPTDPTNLSGEHMHKNSPGFDGSATDLRTHEDAPGLWFRAQDSSAFSLTSLTLDVSVSANNPIYGPHPTISTDPSTGFQTLVPDANNPNNVLGTQDHWIIEGFSSATYASLLNVTYDAYGNPVTVTGPTPIATQVVNDGFNGVLTLNSGFQDVSAIWIFHAGNQITPNGNQVDPTDPTASNFPLLNYQAEIDNVHFNVVNSASVSAVPVPGAVWLFGTGLMGLLFSNKRKANLAA